MGANKKERVNDGAPLMDQAVLTPHGRGKVVDAQRSPEGTWMYRVEFAGGLADWYASRELQRVT